MTDRIADLLDQDDRLSVELAGAQDDGSPILSVIDLDSGDHFHLTLTRIV